MNRYFLAALFAAAFSTMVRAQTYPPENKEFTLAPLPDPLLKVKGGRACGQYFILSGQPKYSDGTFGLVTFNYRSTGDVINIMMMAFDKFAVFIDRSKIVPVVSYRHRSPGANPPFIWTLRLSADAYKAARGCIPPPQNVI